MVRCAAIAAAARFLGAAGSAAAGAAQATRLTIITVLAGRHGPPSPSKTQDPKWTPNFSNCWSAPSPRARCALTASTRNWSRAARAWPTPCATASRCCWRPKHRDASARLAYPVRDGIPVLLEAEARTLDDDELED